MTYKTLALIIAAIGTTLMTGCATTQDDHGWKESVDEAVRIATEQKPETPADTQGSTTIVE